MALRHPIDAEIRKRLRELAPNQIDLAKRIGRSQGWVNKYIHDAGHATIDDLIRIAANLLGADVPQLSELERRWLRAFRRLSADAQQDALELFEAYSKQQRRSGARGGRTGRGVNNKAPGTR